jgi:hypothetical protein
MQKIIGPLTRLILVLSCNRPGAGSVAARVEESAELKPVDRDQVLDPAKFRISGHDDGVHAYRGGCRESIRVGNREAGLEPGSFKNVSEGVCYGLYSEGLKAVKKILSQLEGPVLGGYIVDFPDVNLIHKKRLIGTLRLSEKRPNLFEPAFFV